MPTGGYCELFINIDIPEAALTEMIRAACDGTTSFHYVECQWATFDIHENDEYSRRKTKGEDAFLYSRYIVDVEAAAGHAGQDKYIGGLQQLIHALRNEGATVVAACDFEDLLH